MARKLTPSTALAIAALRVLEEVPDLDWAELDRSIRKIEIAEARRILRQLQRLGFDVVPKRVTKIRRVKRGKR